MPDINTLVADIYSVLSEDNDHTVNEENVEFAGNLFKEMLRTRYTKRAAKKGEEVLRFSALGKQPRQLWYAANQPETAEVLPPKTLFKFQFGDMIEILLLFLAKEAGHEVTHEQHKVEVDGVHGSMDCVIDGIPVDVKSASPYAFRKFSDQAIVFDDPFGYVSQLSGYAHAIGKVGPAAFLAADKVSGEICLSWLDKETVEGNPPGPRIKELRAAINSDSPPPRCYEDIAEGASGNRKLAVGCSYCSQKDNCWSDANEGKGLRKFWYSRGPTWLTVVKKEPKVQEA